MSLVSEASRRIDMVDKKYRNLFIALSVFGISLIMFAMDYMDSWVMIVQSLQVLATMVLLFAIFKRDPLHTDKFLLFWLIISAVQCTTWIILGFQYLQIDFTNYDFFDSITSVLVLLSIWLAALIIGYMMSLIYQEYAELVQDNRNRSLQASTPIPEVVETKEMPPPYTPPASGQLSVSAINV